jgi:hypothetical protein
VTLPKRAIDVSFTLGTGSFGSGAGDTVNITGLRVAATIHKAGGVSLTSCDLRVYGMDMSQMNALSTLGKPLLSGRKNTVTVTAGDDLNGKAVAFSGIIQEAWVDANNAPEVVFIVQAFTGLIDRLKPLPPSSFSGTADAATIVSGLANQMGYAFENNGVKVQLVNPYLWGTGRQQLEKVARAGNFNFFIDDAKNTLAIWPKTGSRGGAVPSLTPTTGLVGYPQFQQNGLLVQCLFNPSIVFGGNVQIQSSLTPACGTWTVFDVIHDLESETPGGKWFTQAQCSVLGHTSIAK